MSPEDFSRNVDSALAKRRGVRMSELSAAVRHAQDTPGARVLVTAATLDHARDLLRDMEGLFETVGGTQPQYVDRTYFRIVLPDNRSISVVVPSRTSARTFEGLFLTGAVL